MQALSERVLCEPTLVAEYKAGRLHLENYRLILAPAVEKQSAIGRRLIDFWSKQTLRVNAPRSSPFMSRGVHGDCSYSAWAPQHCPELYSRTAQPVAR